MQIQARYAMSTCIGARKLGGSFLATWICKYGLEAMLAWGVHGCCFSYNVHEEARYFFAFELVTEDWQ